MEPTEMAGVAEAETQAAYAWALDYDDPDEIPTQPIRLTSRRIMALSLAAGLVVIAMAGAVALMVARDHGQQKAAPAPPRVIETVAPSPTATVTVTVASPAPAPPRNAANESRFVSEVFDNIPTANIPGGRPTDNRLIAYGYEACEMMDRYPNPPSAAEPFYAKVSSDAGYVRDPANIDSTSRYNQERFMGIAALYLCEDRG